MHLEACLLFHRDTRQSDVSRVKPTGKKNKKAKEKKERNVSALVVWAEVHSMYTLWHTKGRRIKQHIALQPIAPVASFHYFTC